MSLWLEIFKQMEDPSGDLFGDKFDRIFPLEEKDVIDFQQELKLEKILKDLKKKFGSPDAEALEYFVLYFIENNFDKKFHDDLLESLQDPEISEKKRKRYSKYMSRESERRFLGIYIIERVFDWNDLPSLRNEFLMKFVKDGKDVGINGVLLDELDYKFDEFGIDIHCTEDDDGNIIDAEISHYQKDYWSVGVNINLSINVHLRVNDEYRDLIQEKAEELVKRRLAEVSGANSMDEDELFGLLRYDDQLTDFLKDFDYTITGIRAEDEADCET